MLPGGWVDSIICMLQQLTKTTDAVSSQGETSSDECAGQVLDVAPRVVRAIRKLMRDHRLSDLSVPQFRALGLLSFSPKVSLSELADHVGTSLPAASRMVDGLVLRKLVARKTCCDDRRQVSLVLTARGAGAFRASRQATRRQLSRQMASLSGPQRLAVIEAMEILSGIYGADADPKGNGRKKAGTPGLAS
jgi:DNA-binding MarR family transcriptional regulator